MGVKGRGRRRDWVGGQVELQSRPNNALARQTGSSGVSTVCQRTCADPKWPGLSQSLDVACRRKGVTSGEVRILQLRKILKELTP